MMSFCFKMSFLDLEVSGEDGRFQTTVHHKPTLSSVYTHFDRLLPTTYKSSMI